MKKFSVIGLAAAMIFMTAVLLCGCSREEIVPPDQMAAAWHKLVVLNDAEPMKELFGYSSEEAVRKDFLGDDFEMDMASGITQVLADMGFQVTDEEASEYYEASMEAMKKLPFTAELTSEDGDHAVVTGKIGYYDADELTKAGNRVAEEALAEFGAENLSDEAAYSDFMRLYMDKYMTALKSLTPAEGTKEIPLEFERVKTEINGKTRSVWLPKDGMAAGQALSTAAMGGV